MKTALIACVVALACGGATVLPPTGQLVVHIGTDAPLPSAPGSPAPTIPPLFDRIRISVYPPNQKDPCVGCVGDFAINTDLEKAGDVSFGALLNIGVAGYVMRVDMFRGVAMADDQPIAHSTVTSYYALPTIQGDGIVDVGIFLKVDDVGVPKGTLVAPLTLPTGEPDYSKVGTWPGAQRVPCTTTGKTNQVCVPGGAFWMGNPKVTNLRRSDDEQTPHLVVVSPYYIDATEVTVADFRASKLAIIDSTSKLSTDPIDGAGDTNTYDDATFCTYTTAAGANETLPVNCITIKQAQAYCAAVGSALVTEAQHEYLAGGFNSTLFSWGDDLPSCTDAVWGRAGIGAYGQRGSDCNSTGHTYGILPVKSGLRDTVTVEGGKIIYDIAGNVAEWTRDLWNRTSESCWSAPILTNPICTTPSTLDIPTDTTLGLYQAVRGGDWEATVGELEAPARVYKQGSRTFVGLRCSSPGK